MMMGHPAERGSWLRVASTVTVLAAVAASCSSSAPDSPGGSQSGSRLVVPEPDLTVAFFADQGRSEDAEAVLDLVAEEGADLVIHTGDFDYEGDPALWDAMVTEALGAEFPYFVTMGNHDKSAWDGPDGYQRVAWERVADLPGVECTGEYGERSVCTYEGLWFLLSAVGLDGESRAGHADYIEAECEAAPHLWKVANWHRVQTEMQVGDKSNQVGWGVYEESLACGAIVSTSHEHSYARTRTLTSMIDQKVDSTCASATALCVGPGRTFAFHSGLGGHSIRDQERCFPGEFPYGCRSEWASIYTGTQDATFGALFITFHVDGDPGRAEGYFKNIDGQVVDSFTITATAQDHVGTPTSGRSITG